MDKVFSDVATFMNAVGQDVPTIPNDKDNDISNLYKKLIKEEYEEFLEADQDNDDVERLDACFDLIWVIVGYMHSRGWDCQASWAEGAQSNLTKIDPETGKVRRRESDGKVLKPDGWKSPDFKQFMKKE
jgi:predicted HAD superfamily Cof-like phosphohydrolase